VAGHVTKDPNGLTSDETGRSSLSIRSSFRTSLMLYSYYMVFDVYSTKSK